MAACGLPLLDNQAFASLTMRRFAAVQTVLVTIALMAVTSRPAGGYESCNGVITIFLIADDLITAGMRQQLAITLHNVEAYFDEVSYGRAKLQFAPAHSCSIALPSKELHNPACPAEHRRRYVDENLPTGAVSADAAYVLIAVRTPLWPFTVPWSTQNSAVRSVAVVSTATDPGTIAHEVAHLLGLPDLFDQRLASRGREAARAFGPWCLMSRVARRPGLSAWARMQLGWISAKDAPVVHRGERRVLTLEPLTARQSGPVVVIVRVASQRYYLIEVRVRRGVDATLPAEGVIVTSVDWFADDVAKRIRIIDAKPRTATLDDAAFNVGMVCRDALNGVLVHVLARTATGFIVAIDNGVTATVGEQS
jgi:mRNA-degrading endonuclease toxin of MazEF toxin-antitoxin module